jgi:ferredoxin
MATRDVAMMAKIKFQIEKDGGSWVETESPAGETIVQAAFRAGVVIQQTCGGTPSCTDCRVKIVDNWQNALEAANGAELRLTGNVFFITHERLACQAVIKDSCSIYVPSPKLPGSAKLNRPEQRSKNHGEEKEKSSEEKGSKKNG